MIQLAHVATGALAGRRCRGASGALLVGLAMHAVMDVVPHGEVDDPELELVTGVAGVAAIGLRHGWRSPVTLAALGSVLPDLEHVPSAFGASPRRAWFPTHRWHALHGWETRPLAIPAWVQATLGGAVIGALAARRPARPAQAQDAGRVRRRPLSFGRGAAARGSAAPPSSGRART